MRKTTFFIILWFCFVNILVGQSISDNKTIIEQREDTTQIKDYKTYNQSFKVDNNDQSDLYKAACISALSGNKNLAIEFLNKALDKGYKNFEYLSYDSNLKSLHSEKEWIEIKQRISSNQRNFSSDDAFKKINEYLVKNNTAALWNLCSDTLKQKVKFEEFSEQISQIHTFMTRNGILNFSKNKRANGSQTSFLNGVMTDKIYGTYLLTPMFFGEKSEKLFYPAVGSEVYLSLICNTNRGYEIDSLNYKTNFLDENFNLNNFIKLNFPSTEEINIDIAVRSAKRSIHYGALNLSPDKFINIDKLRKIEYIGEDNFQEYKNEDNRVYTD